MQNSSKPNVIENAVVVSPPRKKSKTNGKPKSTAFNVDIMDLNGEQVVLSIIFSMRVLLSGWKIWAADRSPPLTSVSPIVAGDTIKRIGSWYAETVVPVMKLVTKHHRRPSFARRLFLEKRGQHESGNTPIGLHIILLQSASEDIMRKCNEGVGSATMAEVKRWFSLMSTTKESSLFELAPTIAQAKFADGLMSHDTALEGCAEGQTEYPFFNAEGLFIQIAHMVWYYTSTTNLTDREPIVLALCEANWESMKQWETSSGSLFCHVFQLEDHGLPVSFGDSTMRNMPRSIAKVDLPYMTLQDDVTIESTTPISISKFHFLVQGLFKEKMVRDCGESPKHLWKKESNKVKGFSNHMLETNETHDGKVQSCEKQGRWYRNKYPGSTPKHPARFPRDVFLLGNKSYFLGLRDRATPPSRSKPKYKCQVRYPRFELD